jgi:hypothetical protein
VAPRCFEDTLTAIDAMRQEFSDEIADFVSRLTDEGNESRRKRRQKTNAKIRGHTGAVRIKLADRISNVESSIQRRSSLLGLYCNEYQCFRDQLYRHGEYKDMWNCLDSLLNWPGNSG